MTAGGTADGLHEKESFGGSEAEEKRAECDTGQHGGSSLYGREKVIYFWDILGRWMGVSPPRVKSHSTEWCGSEI